MRPPPKWWCELDSASSVQLVFTLDPKKEAQAICNQVIIQTKDLQKEVVCLRNLLGEVRTHTHAHVHKHTCTQSLVSVIFYFPFLISVLLSPPFYLFIF